MNINEEKMVKGDSDTTALVMHLYSMQKLQHFVNMMPDGQFLDLHCGNYDRCAAIIIRLDGEVCPVFKTQCCMNPLLSRCKKRDSSADLSEPAEKEAHLSTFSLYGRNFIPNHSSENWLKTSVDSYNKQVMDDYVETEMMSCLRSYIVTAYEF